MTMMMMNPPRIRSRSLGRLAVAAIVGLCVYIVIDFESGTSSNHLRAGRRSLLSTLYLSGPSTLLPWAEHHLVDVTEAPDVDAETALFWHIPKSGGTIAKRLYQCMGFTLAHRVGGDPRHGHDQDKELVIFEPHRDKDWKVANVDTSLRDGILRAKEFGLVQSHTTDLIFTMEPQIAGQELYDEENRGRFLALFRHPVDRALSMFFYLQTATWERTYRPEWADMTVMEYASQPNFESDYVVRKISGKKYGDPCGESDLILAKEVVRQRFVVGLMQEMNESLRRFNIVLGVDEEEGRVHDCMDQFGVLRDQEPKEGEHAPDGTAKLNLQETKTHAKDNKNSNKHPTFAEGTPEFEALAGRNKLDMLLYKYVEKIFEAQKDIIDSYANANDEGDKQEDDSKPDAEERALGAFAPKVEALERKVAKLEAKVAVLEG